MCSLSKEQSILSRETIQNAFFHNFAPFSTWAFYPLSSTPQSVGTRMRSSCFSSGTRMFPVGIYNITFVTYKSRSLFLKAINTEDYVVNGYHIYFAPYEQFLLFPQCFQKTCTAET